VESKLVFGVASVTEMRLQNRRTERQIAKLAAVAVSVVVMQLTYLNSHK